MLAEKSCFEVADAEPAGVGEHHAEHADGTAV